MQAISDSHVGVVWAIAVPASTNKRPMAHSCGANLIITKEATFLKEV
jgi:hypothetical protein